MVRPNYRLTVPTSYLIRAPIHLGVNVLAVLIFSRPGMRDRMMFEHEKYCASGTFSGAYVENFSFFWPYSDQDIINYSHDRDRYEFSPVFLEYVYEYKNWTMKAGFYEKCPEMQYDVPVFQNINSVTELGILV